MDRSVQWVNLFLNDKEYPEDMFVTHEQAKRSWITTLLWWVVGQ